MFDSVLFSKHLEDDETVQMIVHQHWSVGARVLSLPVISFIAFFSMLALSTTRTGLVVGGSLTLISLLWFLRNFFDYYLDTWIVTNHGVIDLEWRGWFHRQSARVLYSDIQGVSYEIHGLLGTIFRFGTVSIEKISTGSAISLLHVPHPRRVEACILQNMETYLHHKNMKNEKHVQELLAGFVAEHLQMKGSKNNASEEGSAELATAMPSESASTPSRKRPSFRSAKLGSQRKS